MLQHFLDHPALDDRWRTMILRRALERTEQRLTSFERRVAAKLGLRE